MLQRRAMRVARLGVGLALGGIAACSSGKATNSGPPGTSVSLNVGQSAVFADSVPANIKLSVASGAQYLLTVVNTANNSSTGETFVVHGAGSAGDMAMAAAAARAPATAIRVSEGAPRRRPHVLSAAGQAAHLTMLDNDRKIFQRIRAAGGFAALRARYRPITTPRATAAAVHSLAPPPPVPGKINPTVGAMNRIFIRNALSGACGSVDTVTARTAFVSNKLIVLEDNSFAQAGSLDSFYSGTLAPEYDSVTYGEVTTNFGDPLLIDSIIGDSLAHLGKVTILLSPLLNTKLQGVAGFVNPCDFLTNGTPIPGTASDTARSNDTEIIYLFTPDASFPAADWKPFIRSVAAHESKHVASFAQHVFDNAASLEESWLEEATAQMSAEIYSRHFLPTSWKGNDGYNATVGCELGQSCNATGRPITYSDSHIPFLYEFMSGLETESVLGPKTESKYGGSWMFARWTTDQFASTEPSYLKSIIGDPVNTGLANLSAHTGQPPAVLLLDYYTALASNNYTNGFVPADAKLTIPSYNLRDLFKGVAQLGDSAFTLPYPLLPVAQPTGSFNIDVGALRGGGASVILLTAGSAGTQSIQVQESGAPVPSGSNLRVEILRVQ